MNAKKFNQCLTLYGSDPAHWPSAWRADFLENPPPHGDQWLAEQQLFEEIFLNDRRIAPAHDQLAQRIIHAARHRQPAAAVPLSVWVKELLAFVLPRPAYALASVAMLGIAIGLSLPTTSADEDAATSPSVYDEEAVL